MARTCRFSFGDRSGAAEWSYDGEYLVVSPEQGGPLSFAAREMAGIAGDGYTLRLVLPGVGGSVSVAGPAVATKAGGTELLLSHLGPDGPTLLERLRREWLIARAEVLRLGGSGQGEPVSGTVSRFCTGSAGSAGTPEPFWGLLFEDVFVYAREGRDLEPLFLALFGAVEFDEATYEVRIRQWPGEEFAFSKMARQTEGFLKYLRTSRAVLAEESAVLLAGAVATLPAGSRGELAGMWMPGRLLEIDAMDAICPGFADAFRQKWLPSLARHEECRCLLDWASSGSSWLGCAREKASSSGETGDEGNPLWLLCGKDEVWFLEALSSEDRATYCFKGGEEVASLVARLLCAPQFSREALYSPVEELAGESADLAVPAQFLGFLVELRKRFCGRVIHQNVEGWSKEVARLGGSGVK
jgi:hypothetical protein